MEGITMMKSSLQLSQKKHMFFILWLIFSFGSTCLSAKIMTVSEAINKAGKQRMITQRMLKDYALIGMNNTYGNPKEDLQKMIEVFDTTLVDLALFVEDKATQESLSKVKKLWKDVKKMLEDSPSKEKVVELKKEIDKLLEEANNVTERIVKVTGTDTGETINIAGRQRMLSQRMASLYMLKVWEIDTPQLDRELFNAIEEFDKAQKRLLASKLNTDAIKKLLENSKKSFMFFKMMGNSKSKKFIPSLINRSANKILKDMNNATALYAKIQ